jgi:site-specific recombinase XerD
VKKYINFIETVEQKNIKTVDRQYSYLKIALKWADSIPFSRYDSISPTLPEYLKITKTKNGAPFSDETSKKVVSYFKKLMIFAKEKQPEIYREVSMFDINAIRRRKVSPDHNKSTVYYKIEDVIKLCTLPERHQNLTLWRDCAALALQFCSGQRAEALVTTPLHAIDLDNLTIQQYPSLGVQTKNSKSAKTFLINNPELIGVIREWYEYVSKTVGEEAMFFTPIIQQFNQCKLINKRPGNNRRTALNKRYRNLIEFANKNHGFNIPYLSSHKARYGHAVHLFQRAKTPAEYRIISQNLMHESLATTDIYTQIMEREAQSTIHDLSSRQPLSSSTQKSELEAFVSGLSKGELREVIMLAAKHL